MLITTLLISAFTIVLTIPANADFSCPDATITLAPASQTHAVGGTATMIATIHNCPGASGHLTFIDLSGPNANKIGAGVIDANGQATFSYSSSLAGTDVWRAFWTNTVLSNTVNVIWVNPLTMTGRAYGIANFGSLLPIAPTPDTGSIATSSTSDTGNKCILALPPGLISASVVCARVQTSTPPPSSTATASAATVTIGSPANVVVKAVQAQSTTNCSGSTGSTTLAFLSVGGTTLIDTTSNPPPNSSITLGPVKVVLNEQIPVPGGLTVNAVHVTVGTLLDVVVSSATSDIHNCANSPS